SSRNDLLNRLRGQVVELPDLKPVFAHWPQAVSPHKEELDTVVENKMIKLFPPGERLQKMQKGEMALFGAAWWPYAPLSELTIVTHFSTWATKLFVWDDEIDSSEYSNLIKDLDKASLYRRQTVNYIHACLFGDPDSRNRSVHPIIAHFKPIGDALRVVFDYEQLYSFYQELVHYVDSTQVEQKYQIDGNIPSVEEYMTRRMGSSAVRPSLVLTEYGYNMRLPRHLMDNKNMCAVWDATNVIISV
ncbi:terpenoid synthase, partial [Lophiostoma macrostomum CBS 122681]